MTRYDESAESLSVCQQKAIDLLALGQTDAEVAVQVGVGQITVTEWRLYHPGFAAALNRKRQQICEARTPTR